jgi:hypothetical protein
MSCTSWTPCGTAAALASLQTVGRPKNTKKWQECGRYLAKHQGAIIDDGCRQPAGKPLGSGRMERGVAQVLGSRQKHKGMRGSPTGSTARGIVKVVARHQQWEQLWVPTQAAA